MIAVLKNLLRFQIKEIAFTEIRQAFVPEKVVQGRIIHQLNSRLFVFRTKGMNLVAEATVPLQVGDFVTTRVKRLRDRVELKLLAVNGHPVEEGQSIPIPDFRYARIPLPESLFGQKGRLEIYDFEQNKNQPAHSSDQFLLFQFVLETQDSGFVLLKVYRSGAQHFFQLYTTDSNFHRVLLAHSEKLFQWFKEEGQSSDFVQILHQPESQLFEASTIQSDLQRLNLRA